MIFYAEEAENNVAGVPPNSWTQQDLSFEDCNIPLVRLRGVTNSYPPQKKSFLMLRHMAVHFSHKYKWFLRADDDVFVNFNTIHAFIKSISPQKSHKSHLYIGQVKYSYVFILKNFYRLKTHNFHLHLTYCYYFQRRQVQVPRKKQANLALISKMVKIIAWEVLELSSMI